MGETRPDRKGNDRVTQDEENQATKTTTKLRRNNRGDFRTENEE
jgi:hypothetical protein